MAGRPLVLDDVQADSAISAEEQWELASDTVFTQQESEVATCMSTREDVQSWVHGKEGRSLRVYVGVKHVGGEAYSGRLLWVVLIESDPEEPKQIPHSSFPQSSLHQ